MQISLRDLIIPLLGSQTWPAGLFQGPPLQVCFHYSQLRITIPCISSMECGFNNCLCFSIILNLKSAIFGFLQLYVFQPLLQLFFAIETKSIEIKTKNLFIFTVLLQDLN